MSATVANSAESLRGAAAHLADELQAGRVYRREDLARLSTAVDRHLRELVAAVQAHDEARQAIYVTIGELSSNAQQFSKENNIRVLQGPALAQLLQGLVATTKSAR